VMKTNVSLGGVASSAEDARDKIRNGYRVIILGFDVDLLRDASHRLVATVHH
jgi:hypothetical protein